MSDLDDAFEDVVEKASPLRDELKEAAQRFDQLDDEIKELREGIEEEWNALEEKARALIKLVRDEEEKIDQETDATHKVLDQAEEAAAAAQRDVVSELDGAQEELKALTDAVDPMDDAVEQMVAGQAEAPAQAVVDRAAAATEDVDLEVTDIRNDRLQNLTQFLDSVDWMADAWRETVAKASQIAQERLDRAYQEWSVKMAEMSDKLADEAFEPAQKNAELTVQFVADEARRTHDARLEQLAGLMRNLSELLDQLKEAADGATETTETAVGTLGDGMSELKESIDRALAELEKMEAFLGRYTFTE